MPFMYLSSINYETILNNIFMKIEINRDGGSKTTISVNEGQKFLLLLILITSICVFVVLVPRTIIILLFVAHLTISLGGFFGILPSAKVKPKKEKTTE